MTYRNEITNERFTPHVIEPSSGADRATLAFLCEAYHKMSRLMRNGKTCKPVW
ncbi:MAG: hypothetical protein U0894_16560 [Pirellulales bacterium]